MTEIINLDNDQTLELLGPSKIAEHLHMWGTSHVRQAWESEMETPKPKFMINGEPVWSIDQVPDWQLVEWLFREKLENSIHMRKDLVESAEEYIRQITPSYVPRLSKREALVRAVQLDTVRRLMKRLDTLGLPDHIDKAVLETIGQLDAHSGIQR